jgi:hypothetical protein
MTIAAVAAVLLSMPALAFAQTLGSGELRRGRAAGVRAGLGSVRSARSMVRLSKDRGESLGQATRNETMRAPSNNGLGRPPDSPASVPVGHALRLPR